MRILLSAPALSAAAILPLFGLAPGVGPIAAHAQTVESRGPAAATQAIPDYSEFARLALAAPVVVDATIRSAERIGKAQAAGVAPGIARLYVTADITTLIRGPAGMAPRMRWLVDVPLDAKGRVPTLRKARVLAFARPLAGRPADLQLVYPDAQRPWTAATDALVRRILKDSLDPAAPPVVTGVTNAFFVPGALPGEGETQIFLRTADSRPISISVMRDAAGARRWTVALSEVVDAAVPPPTRDTLLWYRLACALPTQLPPDAATTDEAANVAHAKDDYAFVIQELGRCAYPIGR